MARVRRTSDASNIRIFRTESGSELAELDDVGFGDENQLHKLIERNIGMLFHGLTFLKREFRELDGGRHIPDTVAFDEKQNTFVVIEYKNKLDRGVIDQAKAYLKYMKKNRHALVMEHIKSEGKGRLDLESYNWDVYAIIMAPEFSLNQIDSAEDDRSLELHEIKRYDAGVMMVRCAGGSHERTLTTATSAPGPHTKAPRILATVKRNDPILNTSKQVAAPRLNSVDGDTRLPDIEYLKGMRHPRELACTDGSRVNLKSWTGVLADVADWLVSKGYLDESHCPVTIGRKNAILNTQPIHQNGKRFRYFRKVGRLYVFLNVNPVNAIRFSVKLIDIAGLSPSDFKVSFGGSTRQTRQKTPPSPMSARVTIAEGSAMPGCEKTNMCFVPHTITIDAGGKVVWTNGDFAAHTVTSGVLEEGGSDGVFDSGMFVPGAEFSHVFEEAGEYPYFDLVHPWMQGVVIVKDRHVGAMAPQADYIR